MLACARALDHDDERTHASARRDEVRMQVDACVQSAAGTLRMSEKHEKNDRVFYEFCSCLWTVQQIVARQLPLHDGCTCHTFESLTAQTRAISTRSDALCGCKQRNEHCVRRS